MQHCTPPGNCSVSNAHPVPVQPGDGGTSWRLEEYITPCQHILAEHIGGYITKHDEEYMGKYTPEHIKKYAISCQQILEEHIRLRLKSKICSKTHYRVYPGIMIMTLVGPAVDLENTSPPVNTFSLPSSSSSATCTKCKCSLGRWPSVLTGLLLTVLLAVVVRLVVRLRLLVVVRRCKLFRRFGCCGRGGRKWVGG